jgi:hypothetical protein
MASTSILRGGLTQTYLAVSLAGKTAFTLSIDQCRNRSLEFTGALGGNCTVTFPIAPSEDAGLSWEIANSATGGTMSAGGPSGNTYSIPQGRRTAVLWNGTDMVAAEFGAVLRSDLSIVSGITGVSPTVTLTAAQANATIISLQGDATGTPIIIMPSGFGLWVINNQLGVGVSVKTATGTAATVSATSNRWVFMDTNGAGNANAI